MKKAMFMLIILVVASVFFTGCSNEKTTDNAATVSVSAVPTTAPTKNLNVPDPVDEDCPYCYGLGDCTKCLRSGDCDYCFGRGGESCIYCIGGRCLECGGSGEVYRSVGLDVKKVRCSSCNSGRCRYCGGTGEKKCSYCNGTGNCTLCRGSGKCQYCYGTGKKN